MKIMNIVALNIFGLAGCALDDPNTEIPAEIVEIPSSVMGGPSSPHCVAKVSSNKVSCFSTFRESIAFATSGRIVDAPEAAVAQDGDSFARRMNDLGATPNAAFVIGIIYDPIRWTGTSFAFSADHPCDGNVSTLDFLSSALNSWNDRISSFQAFANCQMMLFEHINFQGATLGPAAKLSFGGSAMDNQASAIQWF